MRDESRETPEDEESRCRRGREAEIKRKRRNGAVNVERNGFSLLPLDFAGGFLRETAVGSEESERPRFPEERRNAVVAGDDAVSVAGNPLLARERSGDPSRT